MTRSTFDPQAIRQMASGVSAPLLQGASAARSSVSGGSVRLPEKAKEVEQKINEILSQLPSLLSMLDHMTEDFNSKMRMTADAYERTEQTNQAASKGMSR